MTGFTISTPATSEQQAHQARTWTRRAAIGLAGFVLLGAVSGGIWQVQQQQGHGQTVRSRPAAAMPVQQGQASVAVPVSSATNAEQLPSVSTTSGAAGVELVRDRTIQQLCNTEVTICYTAEQLTTAAATSSDDGASTDFDMHFTRP